MKRNKRTSKAARRRKAPGPGRSNYAIKRARWLEAAKGNPPPAKGARS